MMASPFLKYLMSGLTFDFERFREDAESLKLIPPKVPKVDEQSDEQTAEKKSKKIKTIGHDVPQPITSFEELSEKYGVRPRLMENIKNQGYTEPTPIQMQALPIMLERREITACAPTGSGKTAAFLIPVIHHLKEPRNGGFRGLILAPTRELAHQTFREFLQLADKTGLRAHFLAKGAKLSGDMKKGSKKLKKCDVLVTTPNRLLFLLRQDKPIINLSSVEWLIIDESDKLFEEGLRGFRDQLGEIYRSCDSPLLRRALFSATFAEDVEEWCRETLHDLVQVYVGQRNVSTELVDQELVYVGWEAGKMVAMRNIIKEGFLPPVLVFMQSKDRAKELFWELVYDGINVSAIHSEMTQSQREKTVNAFRRGDLWVLICTDLLGRGIDFKGVNLVINYDFPSSAVSYIHRVGRTGRAGRRGKAITFYTDQDKPLLRSIADVIKQAGCHVPEEVMQLPKPSSKKQKQLEKSVPEREPIRKGRKRKKQQQKQNIAYQQKQSQPQQKDQGNQPKNSNQNQQKEGNQSKEKKKLNKRHKNRNNQSNEKKNRNQKQNKLGDQPKETKKDTAGEPPRKRLKRDDGDHSNPAEMKDNPTTSKTAKSWKQKPPKMSAKQETKSKMKKKRSAGKDF